MEKLEHHPDIQAAPARHLVLADVGQPIPGDMDGRVLTEILADSSEHSPNPQQPAEPAHLVQDQQRHVLSDDEETELQARLKGFGYLG